jgi:nitroreductase
VTETVRFTPLKGYREYPADEMGERAREFHEQMQLRRTVRDFSERAIPEGVLERCLLTAGTAPSGANLQPWHFVVVRDAGIKRQIRHAAEEEERIFYQERAPKEWLDALAPLGTDWRKPFLEEAPVLIAVMVQRYGVRPDGVRFKHYYSTESVGLATGLLIAALHNVGLVSLTHTPSPMRFLNRILDRPSSERPLLLLVVGYPKRPDVPVPDIGKKALEQIATFI